MIAFSKHFIDLVNLKRVDYNLKLIIITKKILAYTNNIPVMVGV